MSVVFSGGSVEGFLAADADRSKSTMRLAIVGCGPRGLQCLDSLSHTLSTEELSRLEITVFEPSAYPGAGCIYNPEQPRMLRMNFATQHIDFWKTDRNQSSAQSGSLIGWLDRNYPEYAASDQFVPRAVVGEYLHECFELVCKRLRRWTTVKVVRSRVESIRQLANQTAGGGWLLWDGENEMSFDRVVLTTGHEGLRSSDEVRSSEDDTFVFPVEKNLSIDRVPADSDVWMRGFGLTAIDAIMVLTEGRGGRFESTEALPNYVRSGNEPAQITVHCRSGRPMLAKPTAKVEPITDRFWDPFREKLDGLKTKHGELKFYSEIWSVVCEAAAELLTKSGSPETARDVEEWYRGWARYKMDEATARRAMLQSYGVATGARPMDIPFALGDAWRRLYPEIVELVSFGGLADGQFKAFRQIALEMERIAFGPPAQSVAKLLRLMREGLLQMTDQSCAPEDASVINAVIASPTQADSEGPLSQLILRGDVQVDPLTQAVRVSDTGNVLGGQKGLAVFGRATEGWVVGNDTLSRTLHTQIQNWADTIAVELHG
ncbi:FAD/NAD(P)-binding protein [Rhodopirellula bahusiensis]|uniref:FAD/NAD(P)-binding protein n=1 Tax=Rhodopirellula bahusiensis TaxID=2014065 RepID=UPI0032663DCC